MMLNHRNRLFYKVCSPVTQSWCMPDTLLYQQPRVETPAEYWTPRLMRECNWTQTNSSRQNTKPNKKGCQVLCNGGNTDFRCVWIITYFHYTTLNLSGLWNHTAGSFDQTSNTMSTRVYTWHPPLYTTTGEQPAHCSAGKFSRGAACNKIERTLLRLGTAYETWTQCFDTRGNGGIPGNKLLFTVCLFSLRTKGSLSSRRLTAYSIKP